MDKKDLDRAREICEKCTSGPWEPFIHEGYDSHYSVLQSDPSQDSHFLKKSICVSSGECGGIENKNDAIFIAESRTLLPKALAEIERLQGPDRQYDLHDKFLKCEAELAAVQTLATKYQDALELIQNIDAAKNPEPAFISVWSIAEEALAAGKKEP